MSFNSNDKVIGTVDTPKEVKPFNANDSVIGQVPGTEPPKVEPPKTEQPDQGQFGDWVQGIGTALNEGMQRTSDAMDQPGSELGAVGDVGRLTANLGGTAMDVAGAALNPIFTGAKNFASGAYHKVIEPSLNAVGMQASPHPLAEMKQDLSQGFQPIIKPVKGMIDQWGKVKEAAAPGQRADMEAGEQGMKTLAAMVPIPGAKIVEDALPGVLSGAKDAVTGAIEKVPGVLKDAGKKVVQTFDPSTEAEAARQVSKVKNMEKVVDQRTAEASLKGTKPTDKGKKSLKVREKYNRDYNKGMKTMAENKDAYVDEDGNPTIVDKDGNPVDRPRTHYEMAQTIEKAKDVLVDKFEDLERRAGKNGAILTPEDFRPIEAVVNKVNVDNGYTKRYSDYARQKLEEYKELIGKKPSVIAKRLRIINEELRKAYANPDVGAITKNSIDKAMSAELREAQDRIITNTTEPGYQDLRNQYGALKNIEGDINHRAKVIARKSNKGFFDLTDVLTNSEIGYGIITANPAIIAKGAIGRATKELIKHHNNPDRYINRATSAAWKWADEKKKLGPDVEPLPPEPPGLQPPPRGSGTSLPPGLPTGEPPIPPEPPNLPPRTPLPAGPVPPPRFKPEIPGNEGGYVGVAPQPKKPDGQFPSSDSWTGKFEPPKEPGYTPEYLKETQKIPVVPEDKPLEGEALERAAENAGVTPEDYLLQQEATKKLDSFKNNGYIYDTQRGQYVTAKSPAELEEFWSSVERNRRGNSQEAIGSDPYNRRSSDLPRGNPAAAAEVPEASVADQPPKATGPESGDRGDIPGSTPVIGGEPRPTPGDGTSGKVIVPKVRKRVDLRHRYQELATDADFSEAGFGFNLRRDLVDDLGLTQSETDPDFKVLHGGRGEPSPELRKKLEKTAENLNNTDGWQMLSDDNIKPSPGANYSHDTPITGDDLLRYMQGAPESQKAYLRTAQRMRQEIKNRKLVEEEEPWNVQREPGADENEPLPDDVKLQRQGQDYEQHDLFGGSKTREQIDREEQQRLDKAEVKRRQEETKGGQADINGLPMFENQNIEGSQPKRMSEKAGQEMIAAGYDVPKTNSEPVSYDFKKEGGVSTTERKVDNTEAGVSSKAAEGVSEPKPEYSTVSGTPKDLNRGKAIAKKLGNVEYRGVQEGMKVGGKVRAAPLHVFQVLDDQGKQHTSIAMPLKATPEQVAKRRAEALKGDTRFQIQDTPKAEPFYSPTLKAVQGLKQERGTGEQMFNMISKTPGVKESEWKWMGLDDFLKDKPSVTKQEIEEFVQANQVEIKEVQHGRGERRDLVMRQRDNEPYVYDVIDDASGDVVKGGLSKDSAGDFIDQYWSGAGQTKFSQYTLPGGENYREVLLTLPEKTIDVPESKYILQDKNGKIWVRSSEPDNEVTPQGLKNLYGVPLDAEAKWVKGEGKTKKDWAPNTNYKSSHWDEPNVIAHTRLDDRTGPNGEKVLFIEEIQSDFSRDLRKQKEENMKEIDKRWSGLLEHMKKDGILKVICP